MKEFNYQDALLKNSKEEIQSINAETAENIDEISLFTNLKSLRLSKNCNIKDFSFLKELVKLEELYLKEMDIKEIPKEILSLKNIKTLFIGGNEISDFSILTELTTLEDLGLEDLNLKKVPEEILALSQLKILGISDNKITNITGLKKLTNLEELYVGNNKLKKIPKELLKLTKLRKLFVAYNTGVKDWEVLKDMHNLELLDMTDSHEIEGIPEYIFNLKNLKSLSIYCYTVKNRDNYQVLENVGNLEGLVELRIGGFYFTSAPKSISKLKNLKKLDLSKNEKMEDISELKELPLLEELDLSSCNVKNINDSFSTLKGLKKLVVGYNKNLSYISGVKDFPELEELVFYSVVEKLPKTLGSLTNLRKLDFSAKSEDISFLSSLTNLEELYIADCPFKELPKELKKLKKLTVFNDIEASDKYLENYADLKSLAVNQPAFTLPVLPKLESLSVGSIETTLDLSNIVKLGKLKELEIHRSDYLKTLPVEIEMAKGLEKITFEFLEVLPQISGIKGLPNLKELSLQNLDELTELPGDIGTLENLEKLHIKSLKKVGNIDIVGELSNLRELSIHYIDNLKKLPESLSKLSKLEKIELRSLDNMKDISVLKSLPNLEEFNCEYCDGLTVKKINEVESAINERLSGGVELKMSYAEFIESGYYEKLTEKRDTEITFLDLPLIFGTHEELLEDVEQYSWLDDYLDEDYESCELYQLINNPDYYFKILAIPNLFYEDVEIDTMVEIFLAVDTQDTLNPVYLFEHEIGENPEKLHDSFDDFLANLEDMSENGEDGDSEESESDGEKIYLEYKDEKSNKFWEITITGNTHTVRYGKIGSEGQSKTKEFASEEEAEKDAEKLVSSKKKKGYA